MKVTLDTTNSHTQPLAVHVKSEETAITVAQLDRVITTLRVARNWLENEIERETKNVARSKA